MEILSRTAPESVHSDALAKELNGRREVRTPVGKIDILTEFEVIEVKVLDRWKEAVGQVLMYGSYYPWLGKRIHLIGEKTREKKDLIEIACARVSVRITWADEITIVHEPIEQLNVDVAEANYENLPPRLIKIIETSKTKGWVTVRDIQRCYSSKACHKSIDIRAYFTTLEMMDLGVTRKIGRSMEFKYGKQ